MFKVGDLVWTKVRGFPPWPGIVMNPGENAGEEPKKPSLWVFNFGSKDWYWVDINHIEAYNPNKAVLSKKYPMSYREKYVEGCKAIRHVHKWGIKSRFYPGDFRSEESEDNSEVVEAQKRLSENEERRTKKSKREPADSTSLRFGFLGLGQMGCAMVKNLLHSKHKVTIFDEDLNKMEPFFSIGAECGESPQDVVCKSDITFSCFSDISKAKEMLLGKRGAHLGIDGKKSYVEMTPIDIKTSEIFSDLINSKRGRYLEAQIFGCLNEAEDGMIMILSGGDQELYRQCLSCFKAVAKCSYYLGEVGSGCKMSHCLHLLSGIFIVGLFEVIKWGDAMDLDVETIMDVLKQSKLEVPRVSDDFKRINLDPKEISKHASQMSLAQNSSNALSLSIPLGATANEVLKHSSFCALDRL